jgi:hypothetical protein
MAEQEKITAYSEFWPYYLREHSLPRTRALHYLGTALAFFSLLAFIAFGELWLLLVALIAGYGPAWTAHFLIEKNRPAIFSYPFWSLFSDFRMAWDWMSGTLDEELARAGVKAR